MEKKFKTKLVKDAFEEHQNKILNLSGISCLGGGFISSGIGIISVSRENWLLVVGVQLFLIGAAALYHAMKISNSTIEQIEPIFQYQDDCIDAYLKNKENENG